VGESVPLRVVLDGNVFDKFERDARAADLLATLISESKVAVLMPRVIADELRARPAGMPEWLQVCHVTDGTAVAGIAIAGAARVGGSPVYDAHLGTSRKGKDAVVAVTAHLDADVLVSDDRRCRTRAQQHARCEALTYEQFVERLKKL
jgi:predicted nucleic acid-binding protein